MEETVNLKPSRSQFYGLSAVYLLLLLTSLLVVSSLPFLLLIMVVLLLFYLEDFGCYRRSGLRLQFRRDGSISLFHLNHETCYPECIMYYNRWCMIMKLKNSEHSRSIILTADRFENAAGYASARYLLFRHEALHRAA